MWPHIFYLLLSSVFIYLMCIVLIQRQHDGAVVSSKKVLSLNPTGPVCVEFACSLHACIGLSKTIKIM